MAEMGIKTIGDLAKYDCQRLIEVFGKVMGIYFHNAANAVDNEPVQEQGEAESISRIGTLKQDTHDLEFILTENRRINRGCLQRSYREKPKLQTSIHLHGYEQI